MKNIYSHCDDQLDVITNSVHDRIVIVFNHEISSPN